MMRIDRRLLHDVTGALCLSGGTALAAPPPGAWDGSPVGACTRNYKVPVSGEDDTLRVQVLATTDARRNRYVWIWDPTPEKNPARQLVRVTPQRIGCTILFMPFSESNDFRLTSDGKLPHKVTSALAVVNDPRGAYFFEHEYCLDRAGGSYGKRPVCYRVEASSRRRETVDCDASVE
jgi:hypothetical protein